MRIVMDTTCFPHLRWDRIGAIGLNFLLWGVILEVIRIA